MYGYILNNQMIFFMETVQILWRQRKLNFPVTFHWHANQIRVCASAQTLFHDSFPRVVHPQ